MTDSISQNDNFIINLLQRKYIDRQSTWNYDYLNDPNVLISPNKDIALEWTDYGLHRTTKTQSQLTVLDAWNRLKPGQTFTMYKVWDATDWYKFETVYKEGIKTKNFRTDIPVNRFTVEFDNNLWEYTHLMRPGTGIGQTNVHYFDPDKINLESDVNNLIDQFYYLVKSMIEVSPNGLIPPFSCMHALRDTEGFYFSKGFRGWSQPPSKIIQSSILTSSVWLAHLTGLNDAFVTNWVSSAKSKWESLL
jgi:hypothetical protein